ncbi:MAG: hypothetical protein VCE12_04035, partial [Candidatus Latescibacterota bacterium]
VVVAALVPGKSWDRIGWHLQSVSETVPDRQIRDWVIAGLMALCLIVTLEGERVVAWEGDRVWPYARARHSARLRYLLGMEVIWGMVVRSRTFSRRRLVGECRLAW